MSGTRQHPISHRPIEMTVQAVIKKERILLNTDSGNKCDHVINKTPVVDVPK
jgi:hypothetical protein